MLAGAKQEGTSDVAYSRINPPYSKMTEAAVRALLPHLPARTPHTSRNNRAAAIDRRRVADHQLVREVRLLTHVLEQLRFVLADQIQPARERRRICSGI